LNILLQRSVRQGIFEPLLGFLNFVLWLAICAAANDVGSPALAQTSIAPPVRFLRYEEVVDTLAKFAGSRLPGSEIGTAQEWDAWIRTQDSDVRSRIDRGMEDSISNLILYGTSFTKLSRIASPEAALAPQSGRLTSLATSRVQQLIAALDSAAPNERVNFIRGFLQRQQTAKGGRLNYFTSNLVRFVSEYQAYTAKLADAAKSPDKSEVLATRGTLYANRGLSADTSLLPNFAIEDTLRVMLSKGVLQNGTIRRIAVIGPGLDFTDKRDGYDFYPLQTLQPFAVLEAVERLGLGRREDLQVVTLDLNAAVNAHVTRLAANGAAARSYPVQLPRDTAAQWTDQAVSYWLSFGAVIGRPAKPLPIPEQLPGVDLRAVAITADRAARNSAIDLNIVAQTIDYPSNQGFDLVIATNILVYYDNLQQALAMTNIARMMNAGGIFISNTALPAAHDERLRYLGGRSVSYARDGSYGDDIVVYRKTE
jgi:hypothetical protein